MGLRGPSAQQQEIHEHRIHKKKKFTKKVDDTKIDTAKVDDTKIATAKIDDNKIATNGLSMFYV